MNVYEIYVHDVNVMNVHPPGMNVHVRSERTRNVRTWPGHVGTWPSHVRTCFSLFRYKTQNRHLGANLEQF